MGFRFRLIAVLCALLLVVPAAPVGGQSSPDSGTDPVEVPDVPDRVVVPPRLSAGPREALPDPDEGRDGLISGAATGLAAGDGSVDLGDLPVAVSVGAPLTPEGEAEGVGDPIAVSAGVVVAEPTWASLVSPTVGLAVQVDLFVDGAIEDLGARAAIVTLDYSEMGVSEIWCKWLLA